MNVISRIEKSDDRRPYVLNHVIPNITSAPSTGERKSVPGIENVVVEDERWDVMQFSDILFIHEFLV